MSCEAGTIMDVYLKWLLQVEKFHLSFASSCHSYQRALRSSFVRERKKRMKNKQPRTRAEEWVRVKMWRMIPWSARCSNFPFICFLPFFLQLKSSSFLLRTQLECLAPRSIWRCHCTTELKVLMLRMKKSWYKNESSTRQLDSIFQVCWTFWKIFYSFCCRLNGLECLLNMWSRKFHLISLKALSQISILPIWFTHDWEIFVNFIKFPVVISIE